LLVIEERRDNRRILRDLLHQMPGFEVDRRRSDGEKGSCRGGEAPARSPPHGIPAAADPSMAMKPAAGSRPIRTCQIRSSPSPPLRWAATSRTTPPCQPRMRGLIIPSLQTRPWCSRMVRGTYLAEKSHSGRAGSSARPYQRLMQQCSRNRRSAPAPVIFVGVRQWGRADEARRPAGPVNSWHRSSARNTTRRENALFPSMRGSRHSFPRWQQKQNHKPPSMSAGGQVIRPGLLHALVLPGRDSPVPVGAALSGCGGVSPSRLGCLALAGACLLSGIFILSRPKLNSMAGFQRRLILRARIYKNSRLSLRRLIALRRLHSKILTQQNAEIILRTPSSRVEAGVKRVGNEVVVVLSPEPRPWKQYRMLVYVRAACP